TAEPSSSSPRFMNPAIFASSSMTRMRIDQSIKAWRADGKGGRQRSEVRGQRSEIRGQRSEVRDQSQRSEVRDQRSEVRDQRSEVRSTECILHFPVVICYLPFFDRPDQFTNQ